MHRPDDDLDRHLVDAGPDALIVCDGDGTIVRVNMEAERLFGWSRCELIGQPVETLLPAGLGAAHVAHRAAFCSDPSVRPMGLGQHLRGKRRDGNEFPAEVSLAPIHTQRGTLVVAAVRDVSELRRMERALAEAELHLRELVEQAPIGIFVADLEGRYTDVNAAGARMLGWSPDELIGKSVQDLLAPEEHVRFLENAPPATRLPGRVHRGEWTLRRKDGTQLLVEVTSKILTSGRWQCLFRDISETRRLERERNEALELVGAVLAQCPVGIAILSRKAGGVAIRGNAELARLLGRPVDDLELHERTHVPFFQWPDGSPFAVEDTPSYRTLRGEVIAPMEVVLVDPDGRRTPCEVRAVPLFATDGQAFGGVAVIRDISADKAFERLRVEWNAIVAHDLRNPLNDIALNAQLLACGVRGDAELAESVQEIRDAGTRLNRMVADLLDLSRIEAHKLTLHRQTLDLTALVRSAMKRARLAAPDRTFELRTPAEPLTVAADRDRMTQVLDNLLSNAVKYGAPERPVVVTMERRDHELAVAVRNEGEGIAPDALPRLFQRFQRGVDGRLTAITGLGLGLYITRGVIEAHGGQIQVESTPGATTTFSFTIASAEANA